MTSSQQQVMGTGKRGEQRDYVLTFSLSSIRLKGLVKVQERYGIRGRRSRFVDQPDRPLTPEERILEVEEFAKADQKLSF